MSVPIVRRRLLPKSQGVKSATAGPRDYPLLGAVQWSPAYVSFLIYIFNIISYRLPTGTGTVAMAAALLTLPLEPRSLRLPPPVYSLVALLGWALVGGTQTSYPSVVWDQVIEFTKIVGVVFVAVNVLTTRARLRFFLLVFLGVFAYYPVRGALINYFFFGGGPGGRAGWNYVYENPNDLAGMCLLVLSLAVGMLVSDSRLWIRACALAGVLLLPLVILLTQSRGAFIGILALVVVATKAYWRRGKMIVWTAVATVALVFVTPHSVWKRLGTISDVTTEEGASAAADEGSARQRMEIWKVAATIFAEHPITGVGVGAYSKAHNVTALRPVFDPTARGSRDAHSTYLSMGAETGLPGLLLFLAVIGTAVFDAERTRRRGKATHLASTLQLYYLEVGLLGYLIAGIWGSYGQLVLTYLHVAVISAAATILNAELSPLDMTRRGRRAQPGMALLPAAVRRGMR